MTPNSHQLNVPLQTFQVVGKPCQQTDDLDSHFPDENRRIKNWKAVFDAKVEIAKEMCGRCDVVEQCLNFAIDNDIEYGIWGGATPKEREVFKLIREARRLRSKEGAE